LGGGGKEVVKYVAETWPFWNRTQGHRHMITHEGDWGRGELSRSELRLLSNVIMLHYWGLYENHLLQTNGRAAHLPGLDIVLPVLTSDLGLKDGLISPINPLAPRLNKTLMFFHAGMICRDVEVERQVMREVVRGYCYQLLENGTDAEVDRMSWNYSGGVRQYVYRHFRNLPGYKILKVSKSGPETF
jgi:hypothetical protein